MTLHEWKSGQPGMTVESLAEKCGIQRVAMHRLLSGQTTPTVPTMSRILSVTHGSVTAADMHAAYCAFHDGRQRGVVA